MRKSFALLVILLGALHAVAQKSVRLQSPDKKNVITFSIEPTGLSYTIANGKKTIIERSEFSLELGDGNWIAAGLSKTSETKQAVNETYQLPFGKRSTYTNYYNGLKVELKSAKGESGRLEMRAYNDGLAFRFILTRPGDIQVHNEYTQFNVGANKTVYVQKWDKAYEGFYDQRTLDTLNNKQVLLFPALLKADEQTWCLITEATTMDFYPGVQLQKDEQFPNALKTILPQSSFTVRDSVVTPWRVFITGALSTVVESSLVDNLNPPSQIKDMSWIKPGVAVFPWWADHLASSNEEVLRKYVDAAAEMGWEWIEFDVALVGTDYHTSRLWESTPWIADFVKYAHSKNIKVYGWDELKALNTPAKRAYLYGKYRDLGIDGIKIDFLDSDKLEVMRFHKEALEDAAKYKLMVSFHGETLPRGLRRTWPNLITHEAVRGAEYYTFPGYPEPNPVHNTTLPFTRNVVGSMDYTPCTFSAKTRKTTYAHELALPFVFESGWIAMADSPEEYLKSPARLILEKLEAAWDETKLLAGYPGEFVVMARRKNNDWFIAAINAGTERKVDVDVKSLGINNAVIELYTDGKTQNDLSVEKMNVTNGKITLPLKVNGGFVFVVPSPLPPSN
jgi:alpha-glucosidase